MSELAPCGDQKTHKHWTRQGWVCPACHAQKERERKDADENRLAQKIADRVIAGLAAQSAGEKP